MEDAAIVALYWARDEEALERSDEKYGAMLRAIAYNILSSREDGEECVNDTYDRAWRAIPPQRPGSLAAYLGRITRNLSINRWQANRTQKRGQGATVLLSELADCIASEQSVEEQAETAALTALIAAWLRGLAREDRVLFLRRYWFGDDLAQLADACGATTNKLAGRLYRLRIKLKTTLVKEGISI